MEKLSVVSSTIIQVGGQVTDRIWSFLTFITDISCAPVWYLDRYQYQYLMVCLTFKTGEEFKCREGGW